MRGRGAASIVASPVLVGAVTTLIVVVSVFLAYNANQGLPFVPTYDLKAELPSGANLVEGNEVRVGGFRVGVVDRISTRTVEEEGKGRSVAVIDMKLDKTVEPLATDTQVLVRPRSALGLKYIELTPGQAPSTFNAGDTIPLANAGEPVEFDQLLNTFDQQLRDDSRTALEGYGDALAGRGTSINETLQEFPAFFTSLTNVMDTLNDEETELDQFFLQIGRASAQVAPVSEVQAELFTHMADTFEAFSSDPDALQAAIEAAPPTLDEGIDSFPVQRPFLADFAELSQRLRPAAQELPRSLPHINQALIAGQTVLRNPGQGDTIAYNRRVKRVLRSVDVLASNPNTLLALQDLETLNQELAGLVAHIGPSQSVCNYFNYFFTPLSDHMSEKLPGGVGNIQRVLSKMDPGTESQQYNRFGAYGANRPADIPFNEDPDQIHEWYAFHGQVYQPIIDGQGRADCQSGQNGFLNGPLNPPGSVYPHIPDDVDDPDGFDNDSNPFPVHENTEDPSDENEGDTPDALDAGGGSSTVLQSDTPYVGNGGRAGPNFIPNGRGGLGPRSLSEVP
jgi:virulence factor Mce-like protein